MLDEKDVQIIRALLKEEISASEGRMTKHTEKMIQESEQRMTEKIQESEQRMTGKIQESEQRMEKHTEQLIQESEQRMTGKIQESEQRMTARTESMIDAAEQRIAKSTVALMKAEFTPRFDLLAEGLKDIQEKMVPRSRVDDLEDEVKFLKSIVRQSNEDVQNLKRAT